jgi:hypothetical protein
VVAVEDIPDPLVRAKVIEFGSCWLWLGSRNTNGYGHFVRRVKGKQVKQYTHRYTFTVFKGAIPKGHEVHHACYNRWCCNPDCLHALTHLENLKA